MDDDINVINNNSTICDELIEAPKSYECDVCEKSFSDKSNFRQHIKTHTKTIKDPKRGP